MRKSAASLVSIVTILIAAQIEQLSYEVVHKLP
jgi:hypothetical protein